MDAHRALYRTWRPRRFGEVVGQEHVTRTLKNALATGRLHHAYLFCGPRGTGKTSVARILAQAANCLDPRDGEPCGVCANCAAIAAERFLDLQEIDGASNRGIDEVRGLREDARYAAISGLAKVYIIDEVHMLTEHAWNALLKTLEEPPAHTVFILATTDPRKIPLTALSRCQRFDFRRLTEAQIAARLQEICVAEGWAVAPEALAAVAKRAEGGLRDAESILDQGLSYAGEALSAADVAAIAGAADEEGLQRTLAAVAAGDAAAAMAAVERFYVNGRDFAQVARDLAGALRDRLVGLLSGTATDGALSAWADRARLLAAIDALATAEADMRRSGQPRFVLEMALLRLVAGSARAADPARPDGAAAARQRRDDQPAVPPRPATTPEPHARPPAAALASPHPEAVRPSPAAGVPNDVRTPGPRRSEQDAAPPRPAAAPAASARPPAAAALTHPEAVDPSPPPAAGLPAEMPAAQDPSGHGDDPLARVIASWPDILARLKPATQHNLRFARPVAAGKRRLTLRVAGSYDFLKMRVPEIAQALAGVLGGSWGVDLVADAPEGAAATAEMAAQLFDGELIAPGRRRGADGSIPF